MIPVTDAVRALRLPIVNVAIILACIAVFVYELTLSLPGLNRFFFDYSVIPASLNAWANHPSGLRVPSTIFTSAFLHGGWLHLGGNMIYLWVFGDNVEDALGHLLYTLFYAISAVGAITVPPRATTVRAYSPLGSMTYASQAARRARARSSWTRNEQPLFTSPRTMAFAFSRSKRSSSTGRPLQGSTP